MNKTLVFGRNGFIAKSLKKNLQITKNSTFKFFSKKEIDLTNQLNVKRINKYLDMKVNIIFISAIAPVKNYESMLANLQMIFNFLNFVDIRKIEHFTYISSDAVYSDTKKTITENSETLPNSLHGMMHLMREKIIKQKIKNNRLCILRPTLIYGKGDTHRGYGPNLFRHLISKNKKIYLFGNGAEKRDHVHIDDVVNAIIKINENNYHGTFNLTSGKIISFKEIANLMSKVFQYNKKISFLERNQPMPHLGFRKISNSKISRKLNNRFMSFYEGVRYF